MIERYSSKEIQHLWSLDHKFEIWKNIEIHACEYWNQVGKIPAKDWDIIRTKANFKTSKILEIEMRLHHDVIAFLTNMAEYIGPSSRYVHFGLTSSDIVDTGVSVVLQEAGELIFKAYDDYLKVLYEAAQKYRNQIMVGRTHGIHAEPTTLGLKFLGYYSEARRNRDRLKLAFEENQFGKISGAVGSYSQVPPDLESHVMKKLNLKVEPVSTQVIPRDRHSVLLNAIAVAGSGISRLAQEVRLLQKSESREIEEPFQKSQKGSSAMPHKRNPILSERICGLARVLQGYAATGMQNISLWHERDISHSSAERIILPDATATIEYMLKKMTFVIKNLHVYPENCESVLNQTNGLLYSSRALLVITETLGITREDAYAIVQSEAMKVWGGNDSLRKRLEDREDLKKITREQWDETFNPQTFLKNIEVIFDRVED